MSRRHRAVKRPVLPDAKFKDTVVSKFMSCLMFDGKRSVAEKIVYGAFDRIQEKSGNEPVKIFTMRLKMCALILKFAHGVLVGQPIRCRLKCALSGLRHLPFAG